MVLDLHFLTWVRRESAKLAETWPMGSPLERDLPASWANNRPQMMARLDALKVAPQLAHVLIDRMIQTEGMYLNSGWGRRTQRNRRNRTG